MHKLRTILFTAGLLIALPASAAVFRFAEEHLSVDEPIAGDFYGGGGTVAIEKPVSGDLFAAGGTVRVSASIEEDAVLAGGTIHVNADIGDDLRVIGGTVTVQGNVGGDVLIGGGEVTIDEDVIIGGDLIVGGGTVTVAGTVRGMTRIAGGEIGFNGASDGAVHMQGDRLRFNGDAPELVIAGEAITLGPRAHVTGDVRYWLEGAELFTGSATIGGAVIRDDTLAWPSPERPHPQVFSVGSLTFGVGMAALFIGLLLLLTRQIVPSAELHMRTHPWRSLGVGFLFVIAAPILAGLLCVTLIGLPLGLFLFALWLFLLWYARALAALLIATYLLHRSGKPGSAWAVFGFSLLVFIVLSVLGALPYIGGLLSLAFGLLALGAFMTVKYEKYLQVR